MSKTITFEVTQQHIDTARANKRKFAGEWDVCNQCPIALAAQEFLGDDTINANHSQLHNGSMGDGSIRYKMSDAGRNFIINFDYGRVIEPITLTLEEDINEQVIE